MRRLAIVAVLFNALAACGSGSSEDAGTAGQNDGGGRQGMEGGPCHQNGTCNTGLSCLSQICVRVPADDGGTGDGGPPGLAISGTIRVNGANPPAGTKVVVLNAAIGGSATIVASADAGGNGSYAVPLSQNGNYWVYGQYEADNGNVRFLGAYDSNPVAVTASVAKVDLSLVTAAAEIVSIHAKDGAALLNGAAGDHTLVGRIIVRFYDPSNGLPAQGAVVDVSDGTADIPLPWDANENAYVFNYGATPGGPYEAVSGIYTFSVQHSIFGASPAKIVIDHRPMTDTPDVVTPAPDTQYPAVQDVTLDWNPQNGTDPYWVWVFDTANPKPPPLFHADAEDQKTWSKPLTIPASTFAAGKKYELGIYVGRQYTMSKDGSISTELSVGFVHVSF